MYVSQEPNNLQEIPKYLGRTEIISATNTQISEALHTSKPKSQKLK